jgi:hypothetical protein
MMTFQLTESAIVEICEEGKVNELILPARTKPEWKTWINSQFISVYWDRNRSIYVHRFIGSGKHGCTGILAQTKKGFSPFTEEEATRLHLHLQRQSAS